MALGKNLPTLAVGAGYMYDNLMDIHLPLVSCRSRCLFLAGGEGHMP